MRAAVRPFNPIMNTQTYRIFSHAVFFALGAILAGSSLAEAPTQTPPGKPIFDGKTLGNWKATDFAGHGDVSVKDGQIDMATGEPLTGVNYTGALPPASYEVSLDAMRVDGSDFFCGLTIPVGAEHVTFVVGGWGGTVVGISNVNWEDASENETTQYKKFDNGKWYHLRVRVTPAKIEAWIDDEQVVNLDLAGKRLSMRHGEIELSMPFGIAAYRTHAAFKNVQLRPL